MIINYTISVAKDVNVINLNATVANQIEPAFLRSEQFCDGFSFKQRTDCIVWMKTLIQHFMHLLDDG